MHFLRRYMLNVFCLMIHKPTPEETGYLDEENFLFRLQRRD